MKKLFLILATLTTAVSLFFITAITVGNKIPEKVTGSTSVTLPLSVDVVWNVVSDFDHYHKWNTAMITSTVIGKTEMGYPVWEATFSSKQVGQFDVTEYIPLQKITYVLTGKAVVANYFTVNLVPDGHNSQLTVTQMSMIDSPINRFVSQKLMGPIIAKRYVKDIRALVARIQTGGYEVESNVIN